MNDPATPPPAEVTLSVTNPSGPVDPLVSSAARLAWLVGAFVAVIGLIGLAAGAWILVRGQQVLSEDDFNRFGLEEGPSLADRLDTASQSTLYLVWGALAVGTGVALRLFGDYLTLRAAASPGSAEGDAEPSSEGAAPESDDS